MKKSFISVTTFFLVFLSGSFVSGQVEKTQVPVSPFSKGDFWFNTGNNFWFDHDNIKFPDNQGHENSFGLNYNMLYFPADHIGVGLDLATNRDNTKYDMYTSLSSSTMLYLDGLYGSKLNKNANIYVKAGLGLGGERSKDGSTSNENTYNDFGANLEIGAPYSLCNNSSIYFTPRLGYEYTHSSGNNYTDKSSGIYLRTGFIASLPCSAYAHNCDEFDEYSENEYVQGSNFIGGFSTFGFGMGNDKSTYPGESGYQGYTSKSSYSNLTLDVQYFRYIFNNFAIGTTLDLYSSMNKDKDNQSKQSQFNWNFSPQVEANLPVKGSFHNTYGFLEAGIGNSNYKTVSGSFTSTTKDGLSDMSLGVGYNLFFTRSYAFTPYVDYRWNMIKDQSTKATTNVNGVEAGFTLHHFFTF